MILWHQESEAFMRTEMMTFKAGPSLKAALRAVPNRSEFIRSAVLAALDKSCPLCGGAGVLSPEQKRHWDRFAEDHKMKVCGRCDAVHIACAASPRRARGLGADGKAARR